MIRLLLPCLLAACALGGAPDQPVDGAVDSRLVDAMPDSPAARTLSQTSSEMLEPAGSIACGAANGTAANNYYRVFDLAAFGITTSFNVTQVSFQVEHCDQVNGSSGASVAVRVGTYNDTPGATLLPAMMTILASNPAVMIPEVIEDLGPPATTPGGTVIAPIAATIPAGKHLLVEVDAPNGANSYAFYMGANDSPETAPAFILAPTCGINTPTNINTVASNTAVHLLLTVTGTY